MKGLIALVKTLMKDNVISALILQSVRSWVVTIGMERLHIDDVMGFVFLGTSTCIMCWRDIILSTLWAKQKEGLAGSSLAHACEPT